MFLSIPCRFQDNNNNNNNNNNNIPQGAKRMLQGGQRNRGTAKWSRTSKRDEKKISYGVDWQLKGKFENSLSQNIQDIHWSHKVYWEYHGKLESGTDSKRKKLSWGENLESDLPGNFAITRDDIDKMYKSRKEGGRGLTSIQDCVDASLQWLEDYIKSKKEDWLRQPEIILTHKRQGEQKNQKTKMRG